MACNPNLRLYRYSEGQRFGRHVDGAEILPRGRTEFTVLLYLSACEGGATTFFRDHEKPDVLFAFPQPATARGVVHAHGQRCSTPARRGRLAHENRAVKEPASRTPRAGVDPMAVEVKTGSVGSSISTPAVGRGGRPLRPREELAPDVRRRPGSAFLLAACNTLASQAEPASVALWGRERNRKVCALSQRARAQRSTDQLDGCSLGSAAEIAGRGPQDSPPGAAGPGRHQRPRTSPTAATSRPRPRPRTARRSGRSWPGAPRGAGRGAPGGARARAPAAAPAAAPGTCGPCAPAPPAPAPEPAEAPRRRPRRRRPPVAVGPRRRAGQAAPSAGAGAGGPPPSILGRRRARRPAS